MSIPAILPMPPPDRPRLQRAHLIKAVLARLLLVMAIYTLVNLATVRYSVEGISMQPTFASGQFLLINRLHYLVTTPQRYDVVIFRYPRNPTEDYVKRIIGLPHEVIEIRNTQVYINGSLLPEPYLLEPCTPMMCADSIWQLGADEYFVMGDNRNNSQDSRYFGAVPYNLLLGEVILRYYPLDSFGWITPP